MSRTTKFILVTVWIIFTRAYDAYCSVQYTPDLSREANPLVTVLGIDSWITVLSIIGILSIGLIYLFYRAMFKNELTLPGTPNLSFWKFSKQLYFGEQPSVWSLILQIPTPYHRFEYIIGHILALCMAFAGVVSTIMWLLIHYVPDYLQQYHQVKLIYGLLILGSLWVTFQFFRSKYSVYQKSQLSIT